MKIAQLPTEPIDGDGVRLRPPREDDADQIAQACADRTTLRFVPAMPDPYTHADALWWITEGAPSAWLTGGSAYVIVDPATDRVVGGAGLGRVLGERAQAEIGYWVAPWARRRGVATRAVIALVGHVFRHGFGRLELLTEEGNPPSQRVAIAAGFTREAVRRAGGVGRDGSRHNLIVWARLPDDPPGPSPRLLPDLPGRAGATPAGSGTPADGGFLTDGVVTLRPLRTYDIDDLHAHRSRPEVVATSVPPVPPARADTVRRCTRAEAEWLAGNRADLTIRDAASDAFAGEIGLYYGVGAILHPAAFALSHPALGQAMIGYGVDPDWRGRGFATRAVRLLVEWAFAHTPIQRITAGTSPENVASQRVLERAGFAREGLLRGLLPTIDGGRADDLLYGLLPTDLRRLPG